MNASLQNWNAPTVDGREASELDARKFWQSRMTAGGKAAPLPELTDIHELVRQLGAKPEEA